MADSSNESAFVFAMSPKDSILMGRRSMKTKHPGKWDFFGGRLKEGEDARKAAKREFLEETGILALNLGPQFIIRPQGKERVINVFLYTELAEDGLKIKLNEEHTTFRWMQTEDNFEDYSMTKTAKIVFGTIITVLQNFVSQGQQFDKDTVFDVNATIIEE